MEIRKLSNGYEFINESKGNSKGFVHSTTLFNSQGQEVGKCRHQYYNRTWECYDFQSVMKCCVNNIIQDRQKEFITKCKNAKGIKRLVQKEKNIILEHFEQLIEIKELRKIYKELDFRFSRV